MKQGSYRSGKALRHPKARTKSSFTAASLHVSTAWDRVWMAAFAASHCH